MRSLTRLAQITLVCVMVLAFVGAASAQEEIVRSQTVIFDKEGSGMVNLDLWNPTVPAATRDMGQHQAMWEPLFVLNYATGEIDPWLGLSFEPNETLDVWTLKLRDGVKWADGEAFNADDVVFTVQMMIDNAPELNYSAAIAEWVKSVEKIDNLTVQFTLHKPNPRFQLDYFSIRIWGSFIIVPEHVWKGQDPLTFTFYDPEKGWPFATGPYLPIKITETEVIYERDDDWWGVAAGFKDRLPHPKWLIWTLGATEEIRVAKMRDHELDSIMDITVGTYNVLKEQNPYVIGWGHEEEGLPAWIPDPCPRSITLNNMVPPWDDKDMRWAVNFAINRQEIIDIAYEGVTLPSRSMFVAYPPLVAIEDKIVEAGILDKYPMTTYDPDRAAQILESKEYTRNTDGYWEKDGEVLSMVINAHDQIIELKRQGQVVVEQLQRFGIDAKLRSLAGDTFFDEWNFGNYEAMSDWHSCASVNEPWATMDIQNVKWLVPIGERASGNVARWSGPNAEAYSEIVDQMGVLPLGDPKVIDLVLEAMPYWYEDLPFIPTVQARKLVPFDTYYWTNWPTIDNQYTVPATWWQSTHLILHELEPTGRTE